MSHPHHHQHQHGRRGGGGIIGGAAFPVSAEERERRAQIADLFDKFIAAATLKGILGYYRQILELIPLKPTNFYNFYPKLKNVLSSWRADALWDKFDKRASHKCYRGGRFCPGTRLLIIGAGPCGLRTAIEAQMLGAKVVVIEKRDRISRNNVLHLWPFVIHDLRALGAKKFFGKFCAGSIDHISIRQLQCILLKVALILGVELHEGVSFEALVPPTEQADGKVGWRARVEPSEHPVAQYEFDVIIGADGKRNTLEGFRRKEFRGKLAIAITANFINRKTEAEARVQEISGVAFIFNQKFFKDLKSDTGIDLENIVYYKDDTHYFVMTAKKGSLIAKGVIKQDYADTEKLLAPENVDNDMLVKYAREAADFSTDYKLPDLEFAVNYYGQPDVSMFDFTSMYQAENASRVIERRGFRLLQILVGDSLLEPFWPTGSGCARGFLSSMDACWAVRGWGSGRLSPLEVIAERESIYRLLAQTTPENLNRDYSAYSLDPHTRYPNLNSRAVSVHQIRGLYDTDNLKSLEQQLVPSAISASLAQDSGLKRRRKDSHVSPETLVQWLRRQVAVYDGLEVRDLAHSLRDGRVLCAIISRYRPDLVRFEKLSSEDILVNNQLGFDVLEKEYGIHPIITGKELEECEVPDELAMLTYYTEVYHTFRGEIPHVKHPKLDETELRNEEDAATTAKRRSGKTKQLSQNQGLKILSRLASSGPRVSTGKKRIPGSSGGANATTPTDPVQRQRQRKRRSKDKNNEQLASRDGYQERMERLRLERLSRRQAVANERFKRSMALLQADTWRDSPLSQDQHSLFDEYDLLLYRLTTPDFTDRVRDLEMKLLYPDREMRLLAEARDKGGLNEEMAERIKSLEAKFKATAAEKKPHDLLRSIGRINKEDWQIKNLEDKILENKYGPSRPSERPEKVPKWSKEQFNDKFIAVKTKLNHGTNTGTSSYAQSDKTLKQLKATSQGISTIADQFNKQEQEAPTTQPVSMPTESGISKSGSRSAISLPQPAAGAEVCHFCNKRVYLVERMTADGRLFHRGCFRCEYCSTSLRLGNYSFEREGDWGGHFYCAQHALMPPALKNKSKTVRDGVSSNQKIFPVSRTPSNASVVAASAACFSASKRSSGGPSSGSTEPATPERIEFKNESHLGANSDVEEPPSEMDEAEWTDRNFGTSAAENSESDSGSDLSDSDSTSFSEAEDEVFEEAAEQPLTTAGATLLLAHEWTKRYGGDELKSGRINGTGDGTSPTDSGREAHLGDDDDELSSRESDSESDGSESGTATEGERDAAARELRRREVQLEARTPESGSDTEVPSDEETSESTSSDEKDNENAATEIETDSEFEMEQTLPPTFANIPEIYISDVLTGGGQRKSQEINDSNELKMVHVRSGHIGPEMNGNRIYENEKNKNSQQIQDENKSASMTNLTKNIDRPKPISAAQRHYLLSRTQSTEGIASKISLELKKKYLLGDTSNTFVQKSGSDVAIDNKVRNFLETISQQQKKLSITPPATSTTTALSANIPITPPSPREIKLTPTPVILAPDLKLPPSPSQYLRKQKELPRNGESFKHVCGLGQKENKPPNGEVISESPPPPPSSSLPTSKTTTTPVLNGENKSQEPESDCRPRSPLHETSIVVPELPRKADIEEQEQHLAEEEEDEEEMESDSLSSESDDEIEIEKEQLKGTETPPVPPRVEIHDSQGEIVQADPESSASSGPHEATLALTETELSDWAQDAMVSEDLDDQVFDLDLKNVTTRRRRTKNKKGPRPIDSDHICGRSAPTSLATSTGSVQPSQSLWDMELQFADTGDESEQEVVSATNTGYVQLVEEEDLQTPVVELPPEHDSLEPCADRISPIQAINLQLCEGDPCSGGATTDDTTTSEAVTVKNSPVVADVDPGHALYEAYVRKFQGRISPFSNARDSIDVRKARRGNKSTLEAALEEVAPPPPSSTPPDSLTTTIEDGSSPHKSPTTSRKLEALFKERDKQRSLVHDLVLSSSKRPGKTKRSPRPLPTSSPNIIPPSPPTALHADCQVPFADEPSPEAYVTPPTSKKQGDDMKRRYLKTSENSVADNEVFSTPAARPLSIHVATAPRSGALPDTPLTHPEAFSLPDIRRALFQTPVAPPRKHQATIDSEIRREEARTRARLKSDRELGLSPEENLRALKERLRRGRAGSDASVIDTPVSRPPTLVRAISVPSESSTSKAEVTSTCDHTVTVSVQDESSSSTSPKPTVHEPLSTASSATTSRSTTSPTTASGSAGGGGGGKKKKSKILQQLTGLLGLKQHASANLTSSSWSTSSSSPKSLPYVPAPAAASSSSSSPIRDKLSKFVGKPRDKEKRSKSPSSVVPLSLNVFSSGRLGPGPPPPPVPPPPTSYLGENTSPTTPTNAPGPRGSEESLSEADPEDATTTAPLSSSACDITATSVDGPTSSRRQERANKKMVRQAQLKRLRMAQEIQRQLEEVEVKQRELEDRGVRVERALRGEGVEGQSRSTCTGRPSDDGELLREWFELMRERSELQRFERELQVRAQELELDDRHARLQGDLRERLNKDDVEKTPEDVARERQILSEMLELVERKDKLIHLLEADRQRYQEEDRDLEAQMLAKGVRLTPIRNDPHN